MHIYTGATGDHERVEVSQYAQRRLETIRASDERLYGRILAGIQYYFQAWIPGDSEPEGVEHFAKLSRVCNHEIYRIKDKELFGEWRVIVCFLPRPPNNPMVAELMLFENQDSYNDLNAEHNRNVKRLIQELILAGRLKRR